MVSALFDTSILIDYLNAHPAAKAELATYDDGAISIITWMEVMMGADDSSLGRVRRFLASFPVIHIDDAIAERSVVLRQTSRLKLPDAIIWATAQERSRLLVTRNTKDFPADAPDVRHPYAAPGR
jgi:predicted nucleic acid-binding protein